MAWSSLRQLARQVKALVWKNLVLLVTRHWLSTLLLAAVAPIAILAVTLNIKNFEPAKKGFGVGSPAPVIALRDAIPASQRLVIVRADNPDFGSDIDDVIKTITQPLAPSQWFQVSSRQEATDSCFTNFRGTSGCYAVITFNDSPLSTVPFLNHTWSYTVRFDPIHGQVYSADVFSQDNTYQRYWLPTQLAVENAMTNSTEAPLTYMYTTQTQEDVDADQRKQYAKNVIRIFVIVFFLHVVPSIYHVVNVITTEREIGLSQLVDAMGSGPAARVASHIIAFSIVYLPTWLISGVLYWDLLFPDTNAAILIFWQLFSSLAFLNASVFAAAFFKTRRISSIFVVICFGLLAAGAMDTLSQRIQTSSVLPLSLFFPAMNYIYLVSHASFPARHAASNPPVNMCQTSGLESFDLEQSYYVPVKTFWGFLILQIFFYPVLAILAEHFVHGINHKGRAMTATGDTEFSGGGDADSGVAIRTTGLAKVYTLTWHKNWAGFGRDKNTGLRALNGVDLVAHKRQILCLLGVNGAGKSTTLDLLSGFKQPTAGTMDIAASPSQLGICPQQNVLFGRLTVLEHVKFWSQLKGGREDANAMHELIAACNLSHKTHSQAGTLSGGQKRKLQLACMFVGGTTVCLMDEVTSGLDPISRRAIWNIILAERSKRSMVFTTHFLDEGEVLADHIVILSKGQIKCQGPGIELKNTYGGGYRVYVPLESAHGGVKGIDAPWTLHQDQMVYQTPDSRSAAQIVSQLEAAGHSNVQVAGPTVENVFLHVAQADVEAQELALALGHQDDEKGVDINNSNTIKGAAPMLLPGQQLSSGRPTSFFQQVRILMMKRMRVLPRYWASAFLALLLPIALMPGINTLIKKSFIRPYCVNHNNQWSIYEPANVSLYSFYYYSPDFEYVGKHMPFGPPSAVSALRDVLSKFPVGYEYNMSYFDADFDVYDTLDEFQAKIHKEHPFGQAQLFIGTDGKPTTIAQNSQTSIEGAMISLNLYTSIRSGFHLHPGEKLSPPFFLTHHATLTSRCYGQYASLIMALYPAFFALYPAFERVQNVRALQFSNGVRPLPMWTAYFLFDLAFVTAVSIAFTITVSQQFPLWWGYAYMFPVCLLHGITAIVLAYIVSLRASSQLSGFLWAICFALLSWFAMVLAYVLPNTISDAINVQRNADIVAYTLGLLFPIGNVIRGMAVGFNMYQLACRDDGAAATPGSWWGYGFPITYLIVQAVLFGALLVWLDSDLSFSLLLPRRGPSRGGAGGAAAVAAAGRYGPLSDDDIELAPGGKAGAFTKSSPRDLVRMVHVSKTFGGGGVPAVDDLSLGLGRGEILALLGPNGAGKTTVVDMMRGELRPTRGDMFVRDMSVSRHPRAAQQATGVCPQFDALDLLTARQHLAFYARIKGVPAAELDANVNTALARVGLAEHADKQAAALSGGNRRKLSLAIALMGNPAVLVLDEPSSSMDAAAKRAMWSIIRSEMATASGEDSAGGGRALLLTTHSMEEADALATRAAILSQGRLLAIGTTGVLRHAYSSVYHVQLLLASAPHSPEHEMHAVEDWVRAEFAHTTFEGPSLGGQVKFMVPASGSVSHLISVLEAHRDQLGLHDYSIGAPTLERVFLSVVKDSYVEEEGKQRRKGLTGLLDFLGWRRSQKE
ncbi:hypothetical protein B0T26DRAFT_775989 [Lasiosphaeria miniovina]|uniref:ABC transporter domain-containing protein n=1 Tax=Lasiosphaeria miniovina TaxID=1954250 RepID=A0AA40AKI8_9PEZI|nr:uncharacterized protein B0T26DRAFT_775989 [Lasiosphaeria miniovina]KAK0717520.1 hypothetical protein B0T26DRAFT_775989 [Lasiosphaeria miniovina]